MIYCNFLHISSNKDRACSSDGRALGLHPRGNGIDAHLVQLFGCAVILFFSTLFDLLLLFYSVSGWPTANLKFTLTLAYL